MGDTPKLVLIQKSDHLKLQVCNYDMLPVQFLNGSSSRQQRYESCSLDLWTFVAKVALTFVTPTIVGSCPAGNAIQVFPKLQVQCQTP